MPELLTFLFVMCAILLGFNGAWNAFFAPHFDRIHVVYGMIKLILALITLGWGWNLLP